MRLDFPLGGFDQTVDVGVGQAGGNHART